MSSPDYHFLAAIGSWPGVTAINKFGKCTNAATDTPTDIWDRANATNNQAIWVAPTAARIHAIASSSIADDNNDGTGMRTVRVYGLQTWSSAESSEVVTLAGQTPVNTANSYVMIYRMKGLTFGSGGTNAGTITATAATDSTVTAQIEPGNGQTLMMIFGIGSGHKLCTQQITAGVERATAATVGVDLKLLVKENADTATSGFVVKAEYTLRSDIHLVQEYRIPQVFYGPCIVKLQANASAAAVVTATGSGIVMPL